MQCYPMVWELCTLGAMKVFGIREDVSLMFRENVKLFAITLALDSAILNLVYICFFVMLAFLIIFDQQLSTIIKIQYFK